MNWIRRIRCRWRTLLRREDLDAQMEAEMRLHVELQAQENVEAGITPAEAHYAAMRQFGSAESIKEECREQRGVRWIENFVQDFRFGARSLRKNPIFSLVAVLTLALGIGANTAIFSLVNALLFRPLPFRDPSRLVWIASRVPGGAGRTGGALRRTTLRDWRAQARSFEGFAGYHAFFDRTDFTLQDHGAASRLQSIVVTGNFLELLGIQPQLGRGFLDDECRSDGPRAIILTDGFWHRQFRSDPGIIGRSVTINNLSWSVVGVLPRTLNFSSIFSPGKGEIDFLRPAPDITEAKDTAGNIMAVIARMKPGITVSQAQQELDILGRRFEHTMSDAGAEYSVRLTSLEEHISGRFRRPFVILSCAVGGVLLIACANLSNFLLARAAARRKEIAIRGALGAGRARLLRQLLTESLLLSTCGAVLGLMLAQFAIRAVANSSAFDFPRLETLGLDATVLGFTLLVTICTAFIFGIVPARQLCRHEFQQDLKGARSGSSQRKDRTRTRGSLVIAEVSLTFVLLVIAGLLIRSFVHVMELDLGFRPTQVATWRIVTRGTLAPETEETAFDHEMVRRIEAIPGVESVGLVDSLPFEAHESVTVRAKGESAGPNDSHSVFVHQIDEGYLKTMRIPIRAGRGFDSHDIGDRRHELILVVNEKMAKWLWPGKDPIGQIVLIDGDPGSEWKVVGVAGDARQNALQTEAGPEMYMTGCRLAKELIVRSKGPASAVVPFVRSALKELNSNIAVDQSRSMEELVDRAFSTDRTIAFLSGLFAVFALVQASMGIYGVIAYSVSQRTHEIGIRLALGSPRFDVLRLVIGEGVMLSLAGCVIGWFLALGLTRVMQALLFGLSATDPMTFLLSGSAVMLVALIACWVPARRAARLDPLRALRSE